MSEESDAERSLPATARRLEDARQEGQIARSRELAASLVMVAAAGAFWWMGPQAAAGLAALMRSGLVFDHASALDSARMLIRLDSSAREGLVLMLPLFALLAAAAIGGGIALGGWLFSDKAFSPDFTRMSPSRGLGQMFSMHGLMELAKALLKAALFLGVTGLLIWNNREELMALGSLAPEAALARSSRLLAVTFVALAGCTALIAGIDVPWQLWSHAKQLRMSLEEVKREMRESDGDPQLKARIRSQQRDAARNRMMSEVPKADVVVTNPTHYAVALAYREGQRAPRVVAKGQHLLALKIREVAAEAGVPVLEAAPLARALHRHGELGQDIPWELYEAVALVLAWVMQTRAGIHAARLPSDLPVPPAWGALKEGA